jgi:hypothetical protein
MDKPTNEIELLAQLFRGRMSFGDFNGAETRADPGIELRYDVPDGEGMIYIQLMPFAAQVYTHDDTRADDCQLADFGWDELRDLIDGPDHRTTEDEIRDFIESVRYDH